MDFLSFALHNHPGLDFGSAGGHELAIDFDDTNQAGIERTAFFQVAKRRDVQAEGAGGGEDGLVAGYGDGGAVYGDGEGHRKAEGPPKAERRLKSEIRRNGIAADAGN